MKPRTEANPMPEATADAAAPEKLALASADIARQKREELLRLFPEAGTEGGGVDFDQLRLALGDSVDVGRERYGMHWPGKAQCFKTIQTPSMGTLRPCPEESVNWDTTENMIIEGDNLEVLKLLQKSYLGKVKVIYIDPPYNTGNDFIYPDNYAESLQTYLSFTGQVDSDGRRFGTNTEMDGRFHSNWMRMMFPRLYLARNLLRDDGVIFVSISDDEAHNLRHLMDEVFGEDNFIGCFVWNSTKSVTNTALVSVSHTYNLVYARNKDYFVEHRSHFRLPEDGSGFANPDNDPRGPWKADPFQVGGERPNQLYPITNPKTGQTYRPNPGASWKNDFTTFQRLMAENRIVFGASGEAGPQRKRFLSEAEDRGKVAKTLWDELDTTTNATRALKEMFGDEAGPSVFDNPKPVDLVQRMIQLGAHDPNGAIILDFFAGSGTTGHAVLDLNAKDSGRRQFILVQLPEPTGRKDYPTIADITKERVRRAIKQLLPQEGSVFGASSNAGGAGFRVFRLDQSSFESWNADTPRSGSALEEQMELHVEHIREGRTEDDLLYEILLKSGFPLTTPIETLTLASKKVYSVAGGALMLCLERPLTLEVIRAIADKKPERVVCLDAGFAGNDQLKTNAVQTFKTKGIGSFKTV
ncbi:MAG: site-specific DNA-methyltransferase [Phycisphaeraceae bacterium]|nr:site-specific DNA-methyltransferase [Phycisphaeraceae bacterium]